MDILETAKRIFSSSKEVYIKDGYIWVDGERKYAVTDDIKVKENIR